MTSAVIADVQEVRVLNSHLDWTLELWIRLDDGRSGRGAAPKGETPSVYEPAGTAITDRRQAVVDEIRAVLVGADVDQAELDGQLEARRPSWGPAVVFALSVAFHEATWSNEPAPVPGRSPRLLFNLLNGGLHAYTNPIVSDLTEILVLPRTDGIERSIDGYRRLLAEARTILSDVPTRTIGANRVHDLGGPTNDTALGLARRILDRTGLDDEFELAVDASAGDWWDGDGYRLPVTGDRLDRRALADWWLGLIDRHGLAWVEDPFAETDAEGWRLLHDERPAGCRLLGDNLTSTLPAELERKAGLVDGVLLKPDQNGTVSGSRRFAALAREHGLALITSHRSIETDSPFLVHLSHDLGADAIKVGPYSDFSSVLRSNELIRISDEVAAGSLGAATVASR